MTLFGGKKEHIGIDIGAESIRLVQLSGGGGRYSLEAFGVAQIPTGLSQSDSKLDLQKIAKTLDELIKSAQVTTRNVVSAIPGTSVFNAIVELPPMSESEIAKAITYQAEQNIPLKIDDVKYDWQVIKQSKETGKLTVMIIAAAKTKVNQLMELFGYANLNVMALETATVAMTRSLSNPQEPLVLILDIGSTTTEIAIVENGVLMQTRSFPLAGFAMTRAISKNLGLDMNQAEQFKQKFGLAQDKLEGQVYRAVEETLKNIADEAVRSMKFYQEQSGVAIRRIVLTGGSSRLPLIGDYFKSVTGAEVVVGNPWAKISFQPTYSDKLNEIGPEFATAVGLAMRED
jgi:type IV pilus assembly protein PilM